MQLLLQGLLLLLTLILSTALTLGLTYAPCYASLCSEDYLPYETRLHIATFYALLASTGCFLTLRAYSPGVRRLSNYYISNKEIPIFKKRFSLGGILLSIWLVGIVLATTGFWLHPTIEYWGQRADPLRWTEAKIRLLVTAIIGHHIDMIMGLVIIPVSRNSLLGTVFQLHQSTLLYAHKLLAYLLVIGTLAHGAAYYTFVGTYAHAPEASKEAFEIDNPTYTIAEVESKGYWFAATLPTGMLSFLVMIVITITALPVLRRTSYNTFYYAHVVCSLLIFILISVHASTDFYFLLPGLILLAVDWGWRLFRGNSGGLRKSMSGTLENAGNGWYRISLPPSAKMGKASAEGCVDAEKQVALEYPIQSYYLNLPDVSKIQNHAFTAATVGSSSVGPVFLFQRSQGKKQAKLDKEWTWKLGELVPGKGQKAGFNVRVEGPYMPADHGFESAAHVLCIVGGTGLTGAYSLAMWWIEHRATDPKARFDLIWTVRHRETAAVREWAELEASARSITNLTLHVHVSSESGRINTQRCLEDRLDYGQHTEGDRNPLRGWVYVSGPEGLLSQTETACLQARDAIKKQRKCGDHRQSSDSLEWYVARWEV